MRVASCDSSVAGSNNALSCLEGVFELAVNQLTRLQSGRLSASVVVEDVEVNAAAVETNELRRRVRVDVLVNRELQLDGGHVLRRDARKAEAEAQAVRVQLAGHLYFLVDGGWGALWRRPRLERSPSAVFVGTLPLELQAGVFCPLIICILRSENAHRDFAHG